MPLPREQVKAKENNGKVPTKLDQKGVTDDKTDGAQPFFWPPFQLTATFPPPSLLSDISSRAKLVKYVHVECKRVGYRFLQFNGLCASGKN